MLGFGIADIKEKLQQIRTEWRENTDKQRFYFLLLFSCYFFLFHSHLFSEEENPLGL